MTTKINREFVDKILGMTESRLEMENKIISLLELNDYFISSDKERRIVQNIQSFILEHDMRVIELSGKEIIKKLKP